MKTIDLAAESVTLKKLLQFAGEENVILRTAEGREYLLAIIDDFAEEVAQVRKNDALMKTLKDRSQEEPAYTLAEVRKKLKIK
jgi:hypothetical protein